MFIDKIIYNIIFFIYIYIIGLYQILIILKWPNIESLLLVTKTIVIKKKRIGMGPIKHCFNWLVSSAVTQVSCSRWRYAPSLNYYSRSAVWTQSHCFIIQQILLELTLEAWACPLLCVQFCEWFGRIAEILSANSRIVSYYRYQFSIHGNFSLDG